MILGAGAFIGLATGTLHYADKAQEYGAELEVRKKKIDSLQQFAALAVNNAENTARLAQQVQSDNLPLDTSGKHRDIYVTDLENMLSTAQRDARQTLWAQRSLGIELPQDAFTEFYIK